MKRLLASLVVASIFVAVPARAQEVSPEPTPTPTPTPPPPSYVDVSGHWAARAIRYTAVDNDWLRLSGTKFSPDTRLTRRYLAYGLVRALAPDEQPAAHITFSDLPPTNWAWRYANVAVKLGWLTKKDGRFDPDASVLKDYLSRAVTLAVGLKPVAAGINNIRSSDGYRFKHSAWLGFRTIGQQLRLFWNRPNDGPKELWPTSVLTRADFAFATAAAVNAGWRVWSLQRFTNIVLPPMSSVRRKMVEFSLSYSGFPYHWGGNGPSLTDCSGYVRWVLRDESPNDSLRGYDGWPLPQRASYQMAATGGRVGYAHLRVGDALFWDAGGAYKQEASSVDHTGLYLGNGWMIHQSGGRAGVALDWMGDGFWRERLVWGRHVIT